MWCHELQIPGRLSQQQIFFSHLLAFEVSFSSRTATEIMLVNDTSKMHLPWPPFPIFPKPKNNRGTQYCGIKIFETWMKYNLFQCLVLILIPEGFEGISCAWGILNMLYYNDKQITRFGVIISLFAFLQHHVSITLKKARSSQSNQFCNTLLSTPIYPMEV